MNRVSSKTLHLWNFPMQDTWQCLKTTDNYVANILTLELVTNANHSALIRCKRDRKIWKLWKMLATMPRKPHVTSYSGTIWNMNDSIKRATGKPTKKHSSMKSKTWMFVSNKDKQMEWWLDHYVNFREDFGLWS